METDHPRHNVLAAQFFMLMHKNWRIQKRNKLELCMLLLAPAVFMGLLAMIRNVLMAPVLFKEDINQIIPMPSLGCFVSNNTLAYSPDKGQARLIIEKYLRPQIENRIHLCPAEDGNTVQRFHQSISVKAFPNSNDLVNYVSKNKFCAGITFHKSESMADHDGVEESRNIHYSIRMDGKATPRPSQNVQKNLFPNDSGRNYMISGFVSLQAAVDTAIFSYLQGSEAPNLILSISAKEYPFPFYSKNKFYGAISPNIAFYFCLGVLPLCIKLISRIVYEKEQKIHEVMKIMGLKDSIFWLSWFTSSYLLVFLAMFIMTVVAKFGNVFGHSNFGVIFLFFQLWGLCVITFCFVVSVFFDKARIASSIGCMAIFVCLLPNMFVTSSSPPAAQAIACFFAPTCLAIGLELIIDREEASDGMTSSVMYEGGFPFAYVILLIAIDTLLYSFIAWYLEQVLPREYGIRKKWYFIFSPSYWVRTDQRQVVPNRKASLEGRTGIWEEMVPSRKENMSVDIVNLRKDFRIGSGKSAYVKTAVHKLNMQLYEDNIHALLGHNGAGKSTTISILAGLIPVTSGNAMVYGLGINEHMSIIRKDIGICPQYNILWDELTVSEHLEIFAAIKGIPVSERMNHVNQLIKDVDLLDKANTLSSALSGGQKRKLCVAIAFTGGTRLVFLDEPTSGVDPASRRAIWELLQKFKPGRTIVLTTHFMDEADLLGDQIAIMNDGRVVACGTSLFLKSQFGHGYTLTLVKNSEFHDDKFLEFILGHVNNASFLRSSGAEISYALPRDSSSSFGKLFSALNQMASGLGVESYGLSVTTLEEIFLKLTNPADERARMEFSLATTRAKPRLINAQKSGFADAVEHSKNIIHDEHIQYQTSLLPQFKALLTKRILIGKRDWKSIAQMVLYPGLFIFLAISASQAIIPQNQAELCELNMKSIIKDKAVIYSTSKNEIYDSAYFSSWDITQEPSMQFKYVPYHCLNCTLLACQNPKARKHDKSAFVEKNLESVFRSCLAKYEQVQECPNPPTLLLCKDAYASVTLNSDVQAVMPKEMYTASYVAHYDTFAHHSLPAIMNTVHNILFKNQLNESVSIRANNYPLPDTISSKPNYRKVLLLSLNMAIAVSVIPVGLIASVMREREGNIYHQQLVCGANSMILWLTHYIADFVLYLFTICTFFVMFVALDVKAFIGENFASVLSLFIAYGFAVIPFTYCFSFFMKSTTMAQTRIAFGYVSVSLAALIIARIFHYVESTSYLVDPIDYTFSLFPPYSMALGIYSLNLNYLESLIPGQSVDDSLSWAVTGL
eukprot:TRINITY_DN532_c0_g1_i27.p1 TRINITY_DN532_c0_g1~~TRINITY_DN532_c0_g1_i27.p1  ORF type:complete len:1358 (+),score=157.88 TRINITY_DN532_c0_g1_i27:186-4076(+)